MPEFHQISPSTGIWFGSRVGGSNPLSPTNPFQALTAAVRPSRPALWLSPRFRQALERPEPHKHCTTGPFGMQDRLQIDHSVVMEKRGGLARRKLLKGL